MALTTKLRSYMPRRVSTAQKERELGFGRNISTDGRLMNADGTFNVEREAIGPLDNTYYYLITMRWWKFILLGFAFIFALNCLFALIYVSIGIEHLNGITPGSATDNFLNAYFFSSQTLTTVGYGHISPKGLSTNIVASLESFSGLLVFALISGLLYGRFSRPVAKIVFSDNMVVAPYSGGQGLMFRMGNARKSELVETEAQIILAINQRDENGAINRRFYNLELEINKISFFSLSWTIVHAMNEKSPLYGFTETELKESLAEFLVLVKGTDEANQQAVHTRHSYVADEVIWNAKFSPVIGRNRHGLPLMLTSKLNDFSLLENATN